MKSSAAPARPKRMNAEDRRASLLDAAVLAFARHGFNGTKTKVIAAEAGVTEALLFRHFPTKDDLYAAILKRVAADDWAAAVRQASDAHASDPLAFFQEYARLTLAWNRRRPELMYLVLYSALEQHRLAELFRDRQAEPVLRVLTSYIQAHQDAGYFTQAVPAAHAARTVFGAVAHQGLVLLLLRGAESGLTDEEAARAIAHIAVNGLKTTTCNV